MSRTKSNEAIEKPKSRDVFPKGLIINDSWMLKSDDLNIILMRKCSKSHARSKTDSPDSWEYFYYGTINGALQSLVEKEVKSTELESIQIISDKIDKIKQDIDKALQTLSASYPALSHVIKETA